MMLTCTSISGGRVGISDGQEVKTSKVFTVKEIAAEKFNYDHFHIENIRLLSQYMLFHFGAKQFGTVPK